MFDNPKTIGFKKNWEKLLTSKGIKIKGHTIIKEASKSESTPEVEVERHKTAIIRYDFSKPIKMLIQSNLLWEGATICDYGCSHGADRPDRTRS